MTEATTTKELQTRADALHPWRYNHRVDGVEIESQFPQAARAFEEVGQPLLEQMLDVIVPMLDTPDPRAVDMGCLEGHYTEILSQAGLDVTGIDMSEDHLERADFLLNELQAHDVDLVHGNVTDPDLMPERGPFDVVFFHGLLYHLKDPLLVFDRILESTPEDHVLLLMSQFKGSYRNLISDEPLAELQVKPYEVDEEGRVQSPHDQSVFERVSFRMNPKAMYEALKAYGYDGLIAYDTKFGTEHSYHVNLIATLEERPGLVDRLNQEANIDGTEFYTWDGQSVNGREFGFEDRIRAIVSEVSTILRE